MPPSTDPPVKPLLSAQLPPVVDQAVRVVAHLLRPAVAAIGLGRLYARFDGVAVVVGAGVAVVGTGRQRGHRIVKAWASRYESAVQSLPSSQSMGSFVHPVAELRVVSLPSGGP